MFQRSGSFQDREKFLGALREKLGKLREGTLAGMEETWTEEGGKSVGLLTGFGVEVRFEVGASEWECKAELPSWLPIPQSKVEEMFDGAFADLKGL